MRIQPDKVVRITLNDEGIPVPDQDPVVLMTGQQKLLWTADFDFRITIEDYGDVSYANANELSSTSGLSWGNELGCLTGLFNQGGRSYKYTISANGVDNDPTIDVQP
jgi:hypothetical protein